MSELAKAPLSTAGLGGLALVLLMIGAISKAGAMPFHSWIPDAAVDAPLPFMAILPASLEKLLGIYFLARISLDLFELTPDSWVSTLLMIVGAVTILLAVMMALVQKDYKRLLSYHAISQVGYMILGIGTALPIGHRRRPVPHDQQRPVQELPVPDGRRGGEAGRHDRPGEAGRLGAQDAGDLRLLPDRGGVHLRRSAVQRLLLQGTDLRRRPGSGTSCSTWRRCSARSSRRPRS